MLPDGCAHLHLSAPLPMANVRIHALELHGTALGGTGEHKREWCFPPEVATQIPGARTIPA